MPPLGAACLVVLLEALAFGVVLPVVPYYCEQLGAAAIWVGVLNAVVSAPRIVTMPLLGRWSDRLGRRPLLVISTLGTLSGSIGWALAPGIVWLFLARAVTGILGAQASLAQAIAADVSPPDKRAASVGTLGAAFGIALTLGPAIGGVMAHYTSPAAVGWLCAALQTASLAVIVFVLRETRPRSAEREDRGRLTRFPASAAGCLGPAWRPNVVRLQSVTLLMSLGFAAVITAFPLALQQAYGFDATHTGLALGTIGLIGALVQGGVIRVSVSRFGEHALFIGGLAIGSAGFALLATRPGSPVLWTSTVLLAAGMSLTTPCLNGLISRSVGPDEQGGVMGMNQGVTSLGRAGGAVLAGWLWSMSGMPGAFVTATALLLAALAVFWPARAVPPSPARSLSPPPRDA